MVSISDDRWLSRGAHKYCLCEYVLGVKVRNLIWVESPQRVLFSLWGNPYDFLRMARDLPYKCISIFFSYMMPIRYKKNISEKNICYNRDGIDINVELIVVYKSDFYLD